MQAGYIDRANCCSENIHDEIRYLIGPILSKIKYQSKRLTPQTFVEEGKRIISALEAHEVSKLLKCSVTNRLFFLDTKRSEYDRKTYRNQSVALERGSCSTILRNYEYSGRENRHSTSIDNVGPTRSNSEDWRNPEYAEPLESIRTRGIVRPERPVPPTINIREPREPPCLLRSTLDIHNSKQTYQKK